jgi:hypothetical protein
MALLTSLAMRGGTAAARNILQLEDERTRQLRRLEVRVNALLTGPYRAGIEHVALMTRPDTSPASAERHLRLAEESFTNAFANTRDVEPLEGAWSAVQLVVIALADGRRGEALHWARQAQDRATVALEQLEQAVKDRAEGRRGRLRLTSENAEANAFMGGAAVTGVGAAAAGVTVASGGLALVAVGAAAGTVFVVAKGLEVYRTSRLKAGSAQVAALSAFVDDLAKLTEALA